MTPTNAPYVGKKLATEICGVSIVRCGEIMENCLTDVIPNASIGIYFFK
jgi:uracil phosphoribosyltransferase